MPKMEKLKLIYEYGYPRKLRYGYNSYDFVVKLRRNDLFSGSENAIATFVDEEWHYFS